MDKSLEEFLNKELQKQEDKNLYREIKDYFEGKPDLINFSSNDYLGLARKKFAANPELESGSGASRLTSGTRKVHLELETEIAKWKGTEAALFYGSGYMANLGVLTALAGPKDVIFSDEISHACIKDAIRLSGAKKYFYRNCDHEHLSELVEKHRGQFEKAFIVTVTVFSMEGHRAPIKKLCQIAKKHDCNVYVDEAHGTGVLGSKGSGLCQELYEKGEIQKEDITIHMGTFSKAAGLEGGYIAGSKLLIEFLKNKSKTFIYSTAPSPQIAWQLLQNLKELSQGKELREKLHSNIEYFKTKLEENNIEYRNDGTAIFNLPFRDIEKCMQVSQKLYDADFLVIAIRPPTVKAPMLRVCMVSWLEQDQIDSFIECYDNVITGLVK